MSELEPKDVNQGAELTVNDGYEERLVRSALTLNVNLFAAVGGLGTVDREYRTSEACSEH